MSDRKDLTDGVKRLTGTNGFGLQDKLSPLDGSNATLRLGAAVKRRRGGPIAAEQEVAVSWQP